MSLLVEVIFDEKENKWMFFPKGEIDIYTSSKFKEEVLNHFNSNQTDIIIDGTHLNYIDSTGLGALISILKKLREKDFKIYLSNLKTNIRKIFDITELDKLFIIRGEDSE
ncbi:MAG: STAS domain-containing protein [Tissierellia bacterium]|nr:STAS domain-containing protein [Tissierellia bacterium]